jgi:hypothetical protein
MFLHMYHVTRIYNMIYRVLQGVVEITSVYSLTCLI